MNLIMRAIVSGTIASLTAAAALALAAKREGRAAVQPLNATSHWVHGDQAADRRRLDVRHTALGYGTHHVATILWGYVYEHARERSGRQDTAAMARDALLASGIAALVDYTITPHRLTPGWELVLSKRSMAMGYAGLAVGLAASELLLPRRKLAQ